MTIENEDTTPEAIDQGIIDLMNAFEKAGEDTDEKASAVCRYTHVEVNLMLAQALQELMGLTTVTEAPETADRVEAIRQRMSEGLAHGDSDRDIWHDRHVDDDMETLLGILDQILP